jgi:hypothetical protein
MVGDVLTRNCEEGFYQTDVAGTSRQSGFRANFWPDSARENLQIGPPAGRRPAGTPISKVSRLEYGRNPAEIRPGRPTSGTDSDSCAGYHTREIEHKIHSGTIGSRRCIRMCGLRMPWSRKQWSSGCTRARRGTRHTRVGHCMTPHPGFLPVCTGKGFDETFTGPNPAPPPLMKPCTSASYDDYAASMGRAEGDFQYGVFKVASCAVHKLQVRLESILDRFGPQTGPKRPGPDLGQPQIAAT